MEILIEKIELIKQQGDTKHYHRLDFALFTYNFQPQGNKT